MDPPDNDTFHNMEEALNFLFSNSESRPLTYLLSRFLISSLELRVEKEGVTSERLLFSKREIGNILRSLERWLIWEKIHELKATSIPELVEVLSCDDQTAWRVVKTLEKMKILKVTNKLTHPRGRGNETPIFSLINASSEASVNAAIRLRRILGEKNPAISSELEEKVWACVEREPIPLSGSEIVSIIAERFPEVNPRDRGPMARIIASKMSRKRGESL